MGEDQKMKAKGFWRRCAAILTSQIFYGVLLKTVRGSLFLLGGVMLVSGTSVWKFADSSFAAHDFARAAHWTEGQATDVVTIGIDDMAYAKYFDGRSPLERGKLLHLLQTIQSAAPSARKIVVDLDLAPVLHDSQDSLFELFAARKDQWVLAEPIRGVADENEATRLWRHRLCDAGIAVGLPYLPTEFGYLNTKQQFAKSLADVALQRVGNPCRAISTAIEKAQRNDQASELVKISFPMSPSYARDGMVVPFHGDLQELTATLTMLAPKFIVVGGVWGTGDILGTPFGDRYGVQLHAAAIDGALKHQRALPYVLNFIVMWCAISLLTIVLAVLQKGMRAWLEQDPHKLPGHQFLASRLWPLFVLVLCFASILGLAELLAMQFAWTGLQISTSVTAAALMVYLLFSWNFGLNEIHHQTNTRTTLSYAFLDPIRTDWNSLKGAIWRLTGRGAHANVSPQHEQLATGRAAMEFLLVLASLLLQTLIPLTTMYFSILKSF